MGAHPVGVLANQIEAQLAELGPTLTRGLELIALRALGNCDESRDLVQEVLARAVAAIRAGRVPETVAVPAFVHGIAKHVLTDAIRRRGKASDHVSGIGDALAAPAPSPLDALIDDEEHARLHRALGLLPARDRELLTRCYLHGESLVEIAAQLGVPAERVRQQKSRALQRLRVLVAGERGHVFAPPSTSVA